MKKIKSKSQLEDEITKIKSWRIKELFSMKATINTSKGNQQDMLIRAGVLLLYSHWEGFIKQSIQAFFSYLNERKINCVKLKPNFIALGAYAHISDSQKNFESLIMMNNFFTDLIKSSPFHLNYEVHISTQSNLKSEVFSDLLDKSGIDKLKYEISYNYIDEQLLKYRNKIAHGERTHGDNGVTVTDRNLDKEWFNDLYEKITDIMDTFEEDLIIMIDNDLFIA